jgi:hypothetical protein
VRKSWFYFGHILWYSKKYRFYIINILRQGKMNMSANSFGQASLIGGQQSQQMRQAAENAYVGDRYHAFEDYFETFKGTGRKTFNYSWPAFFMGPFWYFYRKMYRKGWLLLGILVAWSVIWGIFDINSSLPGLFISTYCAVTGRWDYWNHTNCRIDDAYQAFRGQEYQAMEWLEDEGGVNNWALGACIAINVLIIVLYIVIYYYTERGLIPQGLRI